MSNKLYVEYDIVPNSLHIVGAVQIKNKCCEGRSVLITQTNGIKVYSCQCACGGWCTSGYKTIQDAISAWEDMCN